MYEPPPGRLLLLSPRCEIEECRIYFIYVCCGGGSSQGAETTLGVFLHFITAQECAALCVCAFTHSAAASVCVCICVHGFKAIASDREYKTAELINVVVVVARAASAVAAAG